MKTEKITQEKTENAQRQAKFIKNLKDTAAEYEVLKHDIRAAKRIIEGAVIGLKTIAVDQANERALLSAVAQIEAAINLLDNE